MDTTDPTSRRIDRIWLGLLSVVGVSVSTLLADTLFDFSVFVSGILCVGLIATGRRAGYLVGLYNSVAYASLAWRNGLFGEVYLNLGFYVPTGILGYLIWSRHLADDRSVVMRSLSWTQRAAVAAACVFGVLALSVLLARNPEQNTPMLDATTNVIAVAATFLMMGRYSEQWLLYIVLNVLTIGMWAYRYLAGDTAGDLMMWMWTVFLLNAVFGYWRWTRGAASAASAAP